MNKTNLVYILYFLILITSFLNSLFLNIFKFYVYYYNFQITFCRYGLQLHVDVNHPIHGENDAPHITEDDVGVIQPNLAENDVRFKPHPFVNDESESGED